MRFALILLLITAVGAYFRLLNISPHKIYPDAYQNLLAARTIRESRSVTGYLGEEGRFYPDFISWTRPMYPLLINAARFLTPDEIQGAKIAASLMGILGIPLAFFLIRKIFASQVAGFSAALLLAYSFNHTVWGGFILTETTGVFFLLLFLFSLFSSLTSKSALADFHDLVTGAVLGLAILSRYEYAILLLPVTLLVLARSPRPSVRLLNIVSSLIFILALFVSQLFPVASSFSVLFRQAPDLLLLAGIAISLFAGGLVAYGKLSKTQRRRLIERAGQLTSGALWLIAMYLFLQSIFPHFFPLFSYSLSGLREFASSDIALSLSFLLGTTLMLRNPAFRVEGFFALSAVAVLLPIYYKANPEAQRYSTHLIPFLLIPASFLLLQMLETRKRVYLGIIFTLFAIQGILTYNGIRTWKNGEWFKTSYEEKSARLLATDYTKDKKTLLIASFPEPYYYFTGFSTHSVSDTYPYLYIGDALNSRRVLIVQDMGTRDLFPHFSDFLDLHMRRYKRQEYWVHEIYHYDYRSKKETLPVAVYETTLGELKRKIEKDRGAQ